MMHKKSVVSFSVSRDLLFKGTLHTLAGAWAGGTEYGVNFVLLNNFFCFVLCVTSFPFVIFSADLKGFSYIVSHYLYVYVKCFVSHRSYLCGVEVYHTRTQ
jgi:hypothetical protein